MKDSKGYLKLKAAVDKDKAMAGIHDYDGKLDWILERAKHYAAILNLDAADLLNAWETNRTYWYMNYYQDSNFPLLDGMRSVKVFETHAELADKLSKTDFRCPYCEGVSRNPYKCDSGLIVQDIVGQTKECNWNVGGLFTDLSKGLYIFDKSQYRGERIFMPLVYEDEFKTKRNLR